MMDSGMVGWWDDQMGKRGAHMAQWYLRCIGQVGGHAFRHSCCHV